jgi:hypothetical protein
MGQRPPTRSSPTAPPLQPLNYRGRQLLADWMATLGLGQGPAHLLIVSFIPFSHPKRWDGSPHMLQPGHASAITSAPPQTLTFGWWLYRAAKRGPPKANAPFPNIFFVLVHSPPKTRESPSARGHPPPDACYRPIRAAAPGSGATEAVAVEIVGIVTDGRAAAAHCSCCVCGGCKVVACMLGWHI